jgi:hypothetical protein
MKLAQDLGVLDDGIPYAMAFKCVSPPPPLQFWMVLKPEERVG